MKAFNRVGNAGMVNPSLCPAQGRKRQITTKERELQRTIAFGEALAEAHGKSLEDVLDELQDAVRVFEIAVRVPAKLDRDILTVKRLCGAIKAEVSKLGKAYQLTTGLKVTDCG